jgi:hypothetical protein
MAAKNGAGTAKVNGDGTNTSNGRGSTETKSVANRDNTRGGYFVKGGLPGPGRPKMVDNRAYVEALKLDFPPEEISRLVKEAIQIAIDTNSWRGVIAAAEFAHDRSIGKPVKRVESTGDTSLADLLAGVDTSKPLLSMGKPAEPGDEGSDE